VIAQYPVIAAEVKTAVDAASIVDDAGLEGAAQDEARAAVLADLLTEVDSALDTSAVTV
jgi:hypothetical protein